MNSLHVRRGRTDDTRKLVQCHTDAGIRLRALPPPPPPAPAKDFYSCEWTLDEDLQRSALEQQTTGLRHTASVSEEERHWDPFS